MNASSSDERNNDKDVPQTPYYDAYYCNEGNNDDVAPDQATYDKNINSNYDERKNDYGVTTDTPTNGGNDETIDNGEGKEKKPRIQQIMKT